MLKIHIAFVSEIGDSILFEFLFFSLTEWNIYVKVVSDTANKL